MGEKEKKVNRGFGNRKTLISLIQHTQEKVRKGQRIMLSRTGKTYTERYCRGQIDRIRDEAGTRARLRPQVR